MLAAASASVYSVMKNSLPVCLMTGGCGGDVAWLSATQRLGHRRHFPRPAQVDAGLSRLRQGLGEIRPVLLSLAAAARQEGATDDRLLCAAWSPTEATPGGNSQVEIIVIIRSLSLGNETHNTHTTVERLVLDYLGRLVPEETLTHSHPSWSSESFINFLHLLRSIASSSFSLRARQSSLTTSLQVLFGLPLGLGPSTSYSMRFFNQSQSNLQGTKGCQKV